jgi:hypothetical protein
MSPILRSRRSSEPPGKNLGPIRLLGSSVLGQQASWPCDRTLPRASQALRLICRRFPSLRRRLTQRPTWMPSENKKSRIRAFDRLVTAIPDRTWPTKGRPARGITAPPISGPKTSKMEELADDPAQISLGIYLPISWADSSSITNTISALGAGEVDATATTEADGGRPGYDRAAAQGRCASDRARAWPVAQRDQIRHQCQWFR